ncbi:MAG: restriction endonuclease subunit S [Acidobacteria bacterium]|nr:restriction endonuclease subunit S [Acidobacteriota bacterium]
MSELTDRGEGVRRWRLRGYPEYKESGDEWLGKIPAHWEAKRLRFVVGTTITKSEVTDLDPETEVSFVPMEAVREYGGIDLVSTKPLSAVVDGYTYFRNGDVIVAKITPCFENGKGALATGLCNGVGFGTTELHVLRASFLVDPRFLLYLTFSDHFRSIGTASMYGAGGQRRISDDFIRDFCHPVPGLPEQRAIVAFLDRETAKIDALVVTKERLIELLQEKRTALITRAATGGLDANVPMKDSGIEWLGEIPAHWDVVGSNMLFTHRKESALADDQQLTASQQHGVIPQRKFVELEGRSVVQVVTGTDILKHVEPNDFVISMRSFQGGLEYSNYRGCISSAYVIVRPSDRVDSGYFSYVLKSATYVQALQSTSDLVRDGQALRFANFRRVPLPLVPLQEQKIVATYLDEHVAQLDRLCEATLRGIRLLKEFRTGLISAAVTGKIDVCEGVPH